MAEIEVNSTTPLFTENMTGVTAAGSYVRMPEMPFKARIASMKIKDHASEPGAKVIEFHLVATEPGYEGAERRINKRLPDQTQKGRNSVKGWRTAAESVGYAPSSLDTGAPLAFTGGTYLGKEGHFYHTPRAEGVDGSYDDAEFVTPGVYEQRKRALALSGGPKATATAGVTVSGPVEPTVNGAGTPAPVDAAALKGSLLL